MMVGVRGITQQWPRGPLEWFEGDTGFISVPFTWDLPEVKSRLLQRDFLVKRWRVGGPAVSLMPNYLAGIPNVDLGGSIPGVLQRANPQATRTTLGCPNGCGFCASSSIEGPYQELEDWPDLPILTDSNLLAASVEHFDRVMERLEVHGWCDFNQGLDCRFLTEHHAERIGRIPGAIVRLALDTNAIAGEWHLALQKLLAAGVAKSRIRSMVLVGFSDGPEQGWERCRYVETWSAMACPMWFHELDALEHNVVTDRQADLGWTDLERRRIMQWFYQHREVKK